MATEMRKRRNNRHDVETNASTWRAHAFGRVALGSKSSTAGARIAEIAILERGAAHSQGRRGARAEKQSSDFCSTAKCIGLGPGDAGSALESRATSLCQPDGSRCPKQQPHHRRSEEHTSELQSPMY